MTIPSLIPPPPFDVDNDPQSTAQRWEKWIKRLDIYLEAMGIESDKQRRAILLHTIGNRAYDVFCTLEETGKSYAEAKKSLSEKFAPEINVEYQKFLFRRLVQADGESIDCFHTKLRQAAELCRFPEGSVESEIKSQLISGCSSAKVRRKGLTEGDILLKSLLSQGRLEEVASKQAAGMLKSREGANAVVAEDAEEEEDVQAVRPRQTYQKRSAVPAASGAATSAAPSQRRKLQCYRCGRFEFPHEGGVCPANGVECRKCGRVGHFAKWCRAKGNPSENVKHVSAAPDQHEEYVFKCESESVVRKPVFSVSVNGVPVSMVADTGASCTMMSEGTFELLSPRPKLRDSDRTVNAYGKNKLNVIGVFDSELSSNGESVTEKIYVAKHGQTSLLSCEASQKLGLLKIIKPGSVSQVESGGPVDKYIQSHPELFSGVGRMKGYQVKLHVREDVSPVAQPHRRIPYHTREKLEKEVKRLEELDIIEKVDGPTPWVTPVVVAPKPKNPDEGTIV
ncbi:PREDICTED: uncharacterized protein LOC106807502 [Priapulus caudatus]|uniref:Uncharacterized protein LOC106807502 n=1 Tax=Priapulus caudatus TaxID=37621 RepID=A0ABM1DZF8_PRICU|nr:PREDICTED: uncharacterized protein LOC106807502 [Priapulus caudatus]